MNDPALYKAYRDAVCRGMDAADPVRRPDGVNDAQDCMRGALLRSDGPWGTDTFDAAAVAKQTCELVNELESEANKRSVDRDLTGMAEHLRAATAFLTEVPDVWGGRLVPATAWLMRREDERAEHPDTLFVVQDEGDDLSRFAMWRVPDDGFSEPFVTIDVADTDSILGRVEGAEAEGWVLVGEPQVSALRRYSCPNLHATELVRVFGSLWSTVTPLAWGSAPSS